MEEPDGGLLGAGAAADSGAIAVDDDRADDGGSAVVAFHGVIDCPEFIGAAAIQVDHIGARAVAVGVIDRVDQKLS